MVEIKEKSFKEYSAEDRPYRSAVINVGTV
jgi:hypothetical protein